MKAPRFIIAVLVISLLAANNALAFRCGTELVEIGDKTFEVTQRCGEPVAKETVGYTLNRQGNRELEIKEWIYGPKDGYYYYLTFHGTSLVKIESRRH